MDMTALDFTIEHVPDVDLHGGKRYNSINHIRNAPALLPTAGGVSQDGVSVMTTSIVSPENPQLKRCSKCGEPKPETLDYFSRSKHGKNGLREYCKVCASRMARERNAKVEGPRRGGPPRIEDIDPGVCRRCTRCRAELPATLEYFSQSRGKLTSACKKCRSALGKQWRLKNADRCRENSKKWAVQNQERRKEIKRDWARAHREQTRPAERRWAQENPDKRRAAFGRRRGRILDAGGSFTSADIEAIRIAQGNRCYICHKKLKKYHIDHFIPLALGGTNEPGNLRLACPKCNTSKSDKHPHDIGILI